MILAAATAEVGTAEFKAQEAAAVQVPYLMLATALLVLAAVFALLKLPKVTEHHQSEMAEADAGSAWQYSHLGLGALGIFFVYVGGEVAIGSFLVNFIGEPGDCRPSRSRCCQVHQLLLGWRYGWSVDWRCSDAKNRRW